MKKIPVIRMNEHHEAFLCWDKLIEAGYISAEGNYLLHVDHHDDMECGGYDWSFAHKPTAERYSQASETDRSLLAAILSKSKT